MSVETFRTEEYDSKQAALVGTALAALARQTKATENLVGTVYPVDSAVLVEVFPGEFLPGIVRCHMVPIWSGLIVDLGENIAKIAKCWHLSRYPGCAEIGWQKIRKPKQENPKGGEHALSNL